MALNKVKKDKTLKNWIEYRRARAVVIYRKTLKKKKGRILRSLQKV